MKLLCALSPQHCSIKDDTIIFYQLTKNADKLWFNKMQSALRGAPGPALWGHSSWGCFGSESTFPQNKARQKKKKRISKNGCDDIRNKEWSISCVLERLCRVISVQHIFPCRSLNRQNWTLASNTQPPPPFLKPPRPEVYKQPWHLPLSRKRLTLYYCQSVTPVNAAVSMTDAALTTWKGDRVLNLKSSMFRRLSRPAADALLLQASGCGCVLTDSIFFPFSSERDTSGLG